MKITFIITLLILLTVSSYSQNDSIIYLKGTDFTLYSLHEVKYQSTGEKKMEKKLTNLEDVRTITFLSNDSASLSNYGEKPVYTSISYINDVKRYKYRFSPVLGSTIGVLGGGLIGGLIGYGVSTGGSYAELGVIFSALVGAVTGGIIGVLVTIAINHPILDLFSIPDKHKKTELIKFLM